MIESHTAILEREAALSGAYATEPYEVAWATEALFFAREHGEIGASGAHDAMVQISPDGLHWCDEGTVLRIVPGALTHAKVRHFGGWLRLLGEVPRGARLAVSIQLVLKG